MILDEIVALMRSNQCPVFQLSTLEGRSTSRLVYKHMPASTADEEGADKKAKDAKKAQLEQAITQLETQVEILDKGEPGTIFSITYSPSVTSWGSTVIGPFSFTYKRADPLPDPPSPLPHFPQQQQQQSLSGLPPDLLGSIFNLNQEKTNTTTERIILQQQRESLENERRSFREEMNRERERFVAERKEWREEAKEKLEEKMRDLKERWEEKQANLEKDYKKLNKRTEQERQRLTEAGQQWYTKGGKLFESVVDRITMADEEPAAAAAAGLAGLSQEEQKNVELIQALGAEVFEYAKKDPRIIPQLGMLLNGIKAGEFKFDEEESE